MGSSRSHFTTPFFFVTKVNKTKNRCTQQTRRLICKQWTETTKFQGSIDRKPIGNVQARMVDRTDVEGALRPAHSLLPILGKFDKMLVSKVVSNYILKYAKKWHNLKNFFKKILDPQLLSSPVKTTTQNLW